MTRCYDRDDVDMDRMCVPCKKVYRALHVKPSSLYRINFNKTAKQIKIKYKCIVVNRSARERRAKALAMLKRKSTLDNLRNLEL